MLNPLHAFTFANVLFIFANDFTREIYQNQQLIGHLTFLL